jgi:hypothetical protein
MRKWNYDSAHPGRCNHHHCSECAKRRGSNRGNRRIRQAIKALLKKGDPA